MRIKTAVRGYLERLLTTDHMSAAQVIAMIIPIFAEQLFAMLFSVLNTSMVSGSGVHAMSAVGMVDSVTNFVQQVFISLASGGTVLVAQYKGTRNREMTGHAAAQTISSVTILGGAVGLLIILFNGPMLNALFGGADPQVMELAMLYMICSAARYPLVGACSAVGGVLRGIGKTKPCLVFTLVANTVNLLLNIVFLTILQWGVWGLVFSTSITNIVNVIICFVYLLKYDDELEFGFKKSVRFQRKIVKRLAMLGIPFATEQLFFNGGKLLTQTFIVGMGTVSVAINVVGNALMTMIQTAGNSFYNVVITVVGQSIGCGDEKAARKYAKSMVSLTTWGSAITAVLMLLLFPLWVKMYNVEAESVNSVLYILLILCFSQTVFWSRGFIIPGALRAAGDATFTSVAALLSMWLVRVVTGYVVGVVLGFGIVGVWGAMGFEWAARAVIFSLRLRGKAWTKHRLVD